MGISNSFHSSGKSNAISSSGGMGKVQAHNERDYFARHLCADKINFIIGSEGIANQVKDFLNEEFQPTIDEYNARQKRNDRKINQTPFEFFCKNQTMDIAVQNIFQLGDMEYWSRWRTDTVIGKKKNGDDIVAHDFPEEVSAVMDEIYRLQATAFEKIYETDGNKILKKIEDHYAQCVATLEAAKVADSEQYEKFVAIAKLKPKARTAKTNALSAEEKLAYDVFQEAYFSKQGIDEKHLIERTKEHRMHIKLLQLVGHHDEWSLHAHAVSVCWTDGHYERGINSRVAKSTVLNRYALEVLQDKMREIAEREMSKHPEIFEETTLNAKGIGRNLDWTKEEVIRQNQEKLIAKVNALQGDIAEQTALLGELQAQTVSEQQLADSARELAAQAKKKLEKDEAAMRKLEAQYKALSPIKSLKHYQNHVLTTDRKLRELEQLAENVAEETYYQGGNEDHAARMIEVVFDSIKSIIEDIKARIMQTKFYELICRVFDGLNNQRHGERQEKTLEDILGNAYGRSETNDGAGTEQQKGTKTSDNYDDDGYSDL